MAEAVGAHAREVRSGERFEFGANWAKFIEALDDRRIKLAEASLCRSLNVTDLKGKTFLDIGSGSGLFSLAARRLGAQVRSFDYDPQSVACGRELRRRYFDGDDQWTIEEGSVLDADYLASLGQFDVVYSWGVLHHTGSMWQALANVAPLVRPGGKLFIAIYNDQGKATRRWTTVKKLYNRSGQPMRSIVLAAATVRLFGKSVITDLAHGRPFKTLRTVGDRGMAPWRDVVDWVGGYPFEVAKPEEILRFFRKYGWNLVEMTTLGGGHGCCEYVFQVPERAYAVTSNAGTRTETAAGPRSAED